MRSLAATEKNRQLVDRETGGIGVGNCAILTSAALTAITTENRLVKGGKPNGCSALNHPFHFFHVVRTTK
jgi:hypothetical protein